MRSGVPSTCTLNEAVAWFPALSVAVHETGVVCPAGNVCGAEGVQVTVAEPRLSDADTFE